MKKILRLIIIVVLIFLSLEFVPDLVKYRDQNHASLSVTFDGQTQIFETVNESDFHWRKSTWKYLFEHPVIIEAKNPKIHVKFYCSECGKEEDFDMECPTQKMFHCKCRHKPDTKTPYGEIFYLVLKTKTG